MNTLRLKVIENATYDEQHALYDVNNQIVIMSGDYYHDKILDKIEGFFRALTYTALPHSRQNISITPEDNIDLWNKCNFYDGRED